MSKLFMVWRQWLPLLCAASGCSEASVQACMTRATSNTDKGVLTHSDALEQVKQLGLIGATSPHAALITVRGLQATLTRVADSAHVDAEFSKPAWRALLTKFKLMALWAAAAGNEEWEAEQRAVAAARVGVYTAVQQQQQAAAAANSSGLWHGSASLARDHFYVSDPAILASHQIPAAADLPDDTNHYYHLPKHAAAVVDAELPRLRSYLTDPTAMRVGGRRWIKARTFDQGYELLVYGMLGYARDYGNVPEAACSMLLFTNLKIIAGFIGFLRGRINSQTQIHEACCRIGVVLEFLGAFDAAGDNNKVCVCVCVRTHACAHM